MRILPMTATRSIDGGSLWQHSRKLQPFHSVNAALLITHSSNIYINLSNIIHNLILKRRKIGFLKYRFACIMFYVLGGSRVAKMVA